MASNFNQPDKDAGWGLIFRLNALWEKADRRAIKGDLDGWELVLDAIFRNLLYRNEMEIVIEESEGEDNKKIIDVKPTPQDIGEWEIMKGKIKVAKESITKSMRLRNPQLISKANKDHYNSLMFYDVWLRKFMQRHQLYLKEIESNPSKALFGGAFKKY